MMTQLRSGQEAVNQQRRTLVRAQVAGGKAILRGWKGDQE